MRAGARSSSTANAAPPPLRLELPPAAISRGIIDLPDRLRPAARAHPLGYVFPLPGVAVGIDQHTGGLIFPVLPPVLDDHVHAVVVYDEQVLEDDLAAGILDHANDLVPTGGLLLQRSVAGIPASGFLHIEANAVVARHGKDIGAVSLETGRSLLCGDGRMSECRAGCHGDGKQAGAKNGLDTIHGFVLPVDQKR